MADRSSSPIPAIIAWLVILLTVGFIIFGRDLPLFRGKREATAAAGNELQMDLLGKYSLGIKAIAPQAATQPAARDRTIDQLVKLEKTPRDSVRSAVIAGEMDGAHAAITHLDHISPTTEPALADELKSLHVIYQQSPDALDAQQRQQLIDRYDFFGRLALTFNKPDSDASRAELLSIGKRVLIIVLGFAALMFVLFLAGLGLLITAFVLSLLGKLKRYFVPPQAANSAYLESFALYLVGFIALGLVLGKVFVHQNWLVWEWLLIVMLPVAMFWAVLRGNSWQQVRHAFGWYRGRGWLIEALLGVVGYIAGLPVVAVGLYITSRLIPYAREMPTHPIMKEFQAGPSHIMLVYLLACVFAPVFEESMFRGALFAHLRRRWGWIMSALPVSLIFAAIHPQGWTTIPLLGSIALVLAALREWRGSIIAPIVCHACVNFGTITLLVALTR